MLKFKDAVAYIQGISLNAIRAIAEAYHVYRQMGRDSLTVTSINDGKHSKESLHYKGEAFDIRTRDDDSGIQWSDATKDLIAKTLRERLGPDYDVVVERHHIHCEYDPK